MANQKPGSSDSGPSKTFNHPSASNTPCRNIYIHGFCKFADKGCSYNHDSQPYTYNSVTFTTPAAKKKLNAEPASFKPYTNVNAPNFQPSLSVIAGANTPSSSTSTPASATPAPSAVINPSGSSPSLQGLNKAKISPKVSGISPFIPKNFQNGQVAPESAGSSQYSPEIFRPSQSTPFKPQSSPGMTGLPTQLSQPSLSAFSNYDMSNGGMEYSGLPQYNQDIYYQPHTSYPLQYHLYSPSGYQARHLGPHQRVPENYFIPNNIRESLQQKNEAALQTLPTSTLPEIVNSYHSLVPLDTSLEKSTRVFGHPSWVYKACSNVDGKLYALRRIEGFRLTNERAMGCAHAWIKLCFPGQNNSNSSPNTAQPSRCSNSAIVGLKEAFTTRAFGDNSLVFVYEYYPNSQTLMSTHFGPESYQQMNRIVTSEKLIWGYISQLLLALKTIHGAKLAARIVEPTRILVTDNNRIRLNGCGIFDVLDYENNSGANGLSSPEDLAASLERHQQEDIHNLGKIILSLCNSTIGAPQYLQNSLASLSKNYSTALYEFVKYILDNDAEGTEGQEASFPAHHNVGPKEKLTHLIELSATASLDVLNDNLNYNTLLLDSLSTELENGRLVRLLCKLGAINERPEYENDPAWSDTGIRYPLKLFRDYVFHQTNEVGEPVVDLGHILRELNKLDAGIDEQVLLVGRDERTYMIVSYRELKEAVGSAFRNLTSGQSKPGSKLKIGSSASNSAMIQQSANNHAQSGRVLMGGM